MTRHTKYAPPGLRFIAGGLLALVMAGNASDLLAQGVFGVPESGWTYIFQGDAADPGSGGFTALDGTWNPENGSAQWDGSAIGEGNPGGVSALSDGDASFIRIQDTGDPRDSLGISDPGSNRKEYFGHDITAEGASDTIIDDGVTLYFRARIATAATGPVDDLHPDGGDASSITPWPERGIGYFQHNSGKSPFTIKQAAAGNGANVAFGLAYGDDIDEVKYGTGGVLVLPHLKEGQELSNDSDPLDDLSQFEVANSLPVEDPTQWQDFWINIEKGSVVQDPEAPEFVDGTHKVTVYSGTGDDPLEAHEFFINAATGDDFAGLSYLALGAGGTPRAGAFDVDFFAWAPGLLTPELAQTNPGLAADFDGDGVVGLLDFGILKSNFGDAGDKAAGDADGDGEIGLTDFDVLKTTFGQSAEVPEPSTIVLSLLGIVALCFRAVRRRT